MEEAEAEGPITKRSTEIREDEVEVEVTREMTVEVITAIEEERVEAIFTLL